jgi:phenylacetate-CoA ligase
MGRETLACLRELESLQWVPPEEVRSLQRRKLRALLRHARDQTPFYRARFEKAGFDPETMESLDDFKRLPPLSKSEIRGHLDEMVWDDCPGGLQRYSTGGSTGEPLVFYFDRRRQAWDKAARALTHQWWGVDVGDRELYLWGSPLEIKRQDRVKDLRDRLTNDLLISAFEISEARVPEIVERFRRFRPDCVFGYPSTISLFSRMADAQGCDLRGVGVRVVFTTAETLYEEQRERIGAAFGGVPVVDGYGSREAGFISHQCAEGRYHVIDPNYILEYVKEDGTDAEPGEDGEIVVTHLDAWGMPLVRYRTGDVARPGEGACPCGRSWSTMAAVRGRTTDFVVTPDGRWQHALSLIYVVREIEGVAEFKIVQERVDDVRVLLCVDPAYPSNGDHRIVSGIRKRMGGAVQVQVEHVERIPRDLSGKYRYVVSRVSRDVKGSAP